MRRTRSWVGIVLALVTALTLAACTRPTPPDVDAGRELNVGATAEPDGLDPITVSGAGTSFVLLYNVYETLVKIDSEGAIRPLLATDWTISDDRLTYTFTLESRARFASGAPVNADAVVKSFDRARGEGATDQIRAQWAAVESVEATGDHTVEVKLSTPSNMWLYNITGPAGLISDPTATGDLNATPAGSGPYKFKRWDQGSLVQLEANSGYWGTPARFSPVNFRFYTDPNTMTTSMLSGQLDIISNLTTPQAIDQFSDTSKYTVHEGATQGEVVLGFNNATPALADLLVRQAINHAIDREALVESAWGGKGQLIGSMVSPTDPWYEDLSQAYPFDQAKAKQLLSEAGKASGLTLRLRVPNLPYATASARVISAQLAEVGITAKVEELEFPTWLDQVYAKHDYDMTIVAHVEPRDIVAFGVEGNYWGFNNPEFNALLASADEGTQEEQVADLKAAAKLLSDQAAADWLFLLPNIIVTTPEISGVQENATSLSFDLTTLAARS